MIQFEKLDKHKTYLGLEYGESFISKQIERFTAQYAPYALNIPSHAFALVYKFGEWWIYESHATAKKGLPAGVRKYKQSKFEEIEKSKLTRFCSYPLRLNKRELEIHLGEPYGYGDIKSLCHAALHKSNGEQKDSEGLICSEYIALAYPRICKFFKLPAWCITPAHFQNYIERGAHERQT